MIIVDILKESCKQVYEQTRDLAGTEEGNRKFGKGAGGDISRKIDLLAEETVINTIRKFNFRPTIIGEECGYIEGTDGFLIMDAIDGTTNASRGLPFFCCSLAYATEFKLSSVVDSAIIDLSTGDLFHSSKGNGAYLNDKKILKSIRKEEAINEKDQEEKDILISVNISGVSEEIVSRLSKVISISNHTRYFGANALELCYLARGYLDAYIDFRGKIRSTDMAAAFLIVKESGGKLYSNNGKELDADLGVNTTMSFLAVYDDKLFHKLAPYLALDRV
jgi:myo-inositol-1(or 4)-monophosphatase